MKEIQKKELVRCVAFIEALGCKFKVITPDGKEFGGLEVAPPKAYKRTPLQHPYGAIATYYRTVLNFDAEVGSVQEVPCGEFPIKSLKSGIARELTARWGKDAFDIVITDDTVEVLRTAKEDSNG